MALFVGRAVTVFSFRENNNIRGQRRGMAVGQVIEH